MDQLKLAGLAAWHLLLTLPSFGYHGSLNLYRRFVSWPANPPLPRIAFGQNVVVFVHGRGGHPSQFDTTIWNLKSILPTSYLLQTVNLGNTFSTKLDSDVAMLEQELKIYSNCNLILVGVSKGGLICLRYLATKSDPRIQKVISISSPLQGTQATSLTSPSSLVHQELGYQSPITQETYKLLTKDQLEHQIYHIVPKWDYLIIPNTAAAYPDTNPDHIYQYEGYYSHIVIPHSVEIANILSKFIGQ